jgi:hypothetical protein
MSRKYQDPRVGKLMHDGSSGVGATQSGQTNIHDDQAGAMFAVGVHRALAAAYVRDHLHVGLDIWR